MSALLEVRDLKVDYHTRGSVVHAVRGVDFDVEAGRVLAIAGESGCGKSVTAKAIMSLVRRPGTVLQGSSIRFDGREVTGFDRKELDAFRGHDCAMIFQDALVSLNPTKRIEPQLVEALRNHQVMSAAQMRERAIQMLTEVGIADPADVLRRYPHELSGGMRQRVMIASALIDHPRLVIADEPTTSLDVTKQAQVLDLLVRLKDELGMAVIMITHDMGVVARMADDVMVMYAGKVVESGDVESVFYHPKHPYTWALLDSCPGVDVDPAEPLRTIEGSAPDLTRGIAGCAFRERCPYAMRACEVAEPAPAHASPGHTVRCWLTDPRADLDGIECGRRFR